MNDTALTIEPSDATLIEQYGKIEAYVAKRQEALSEELKEHKEAMSAIKEMLLQRLNQRSPNLQMPANTKTEFGTAYRVRHVKAKVVEQTTFLNFCIENWEAFGSDMLAVNAVTEPLKKWIEEHTDQNTGQEHFPPGLEVNRSVTVNIR